MARAGSSSSKSKPSKPAPQPKYFAEVALVYGSGEKMIYFNNQRDLDRFIIDVTKRKLDSHPLRFVPPMQLLLAPRLRCFSFQLQQDAGTEQLI